MRDTLEDLYYGNITPCDKRIKPGTTLQQTLDEAEQCEERLTAKLDDEGKALLQQWGVEGEWIGIGHCILGYAAEPEKPAAPRLEGRIVRI